MSLASDLAGTSHRRRWKTSRVYRFLHRDGDMDILFALALVYTPLVVWLAHDAWKLLGILGLMTAGFASGYPSERAKNRSEWVRKEIRRRKWAWDHGFEV